MPNMYHVGLNPDAPYDVVHLAGFEFPKRSEKVTGVGVETKREPVDGAYLDLTPEDCERIKAAAAQKVFRFIRAQTGKKKGALVRAFLVSKTGAGVLNGKMRPYVPQPDDRAVADFIYMEEVAHNPITGPRRRKTLGEQMGTPSAGSPIAMERGETEDEPKRSRKVRA